MKKSFIEPISAAAFVDKKLAIYASCDADIKDINALMDREILEVRKKYYDSITAYQKQKEIAFNDLETFASLNQDLLFSVKRSVKTKLGTIGFRTGMPRFILHSPGTWDSVTEFLQKHLPDYVKAVYEPKKDKLIADRFIPEIARYFPGMDLQIVQDDHFFINLNK